MYQTNSQNMDANKENTSPLLGLHSAAGAVAAKLQNLNASLAITLDAMEKDISAAEAASISTDSRKASAAALFLTASMDNRYLPALHSCRDLLTSAASDLLEISKWEGL